MGSPLNQDDGCGIIPPNLMPQLTIPEEYAAGMAQLLALPDDAVRELTLALAGTPFLDIRNADAVTSAISASVPSVPANDLRPVMATLLALSSVSASSDVSTEEFVDDIVRALKRSRRSDLSLDDSSVSRTRNRLKTLLSLGALTTPAKAAAIQHEHEHTLCTLRIFTDARPVYGDDPAAAPSAVAITHMLKLTYHEGAKTEDIYIAFDKQDLLNLKSQIARAESKASSLRTVFTSVSVPVIE
jgi:hypothetical protein